MPTRTVAFLLGILFLTYQTDILPSIFSFAIIVLVPLFFIKKPIISISAWFVVGFLWASCAASIILNDRLANKLQGKNVIVRGYIADIPHKYPKKTRFEFTVEQLIFEQQIYTSPSRILLNWYGKVPQLKAGEFWQLEVRLKRPHGFLNPAGFDYQKWMFQHQLGAKGYVRSSSKNMPLQNSTRLPSIHVLRQSFKDTLTRYIQSPYQEILLALLIGERSGIKKSQWDTFRSTGTSHLVAISGLHIGLVAGLIFFISRRIWSLNYYLCERLPATKFAAIVAILAAVFYSALAGFSIPTQRALIMLMVVMGSILVAKRTDVWRTLFIALLLVLLYEPLSVLSAGFWLSFCAVVFILYVVVGRQFTIPRWQQWTKIQISIGIGLTPFVLLFFSQSSIISPAANLFAIPIISFIIVPLVLVGSCLLYIFPAVGVLLLNIALWFLDKLWWLLDVLANLPLSTFELNAVSLIAFSFACLGAIIVTMPRGLPARWMAIVFFLPLFFTAFPRLQYNHVLVTLLDVGQGLSVVVMTRNHTLVFDTGPKYGSNFDTGRAVVLPFLKQYGITKIDKLVLSHGDNDHIGGLKSILQAMSVTEIISSIDPRLRQTQLAGRTMTHCSSGQQWRWEGISFQFLHPPTDSPYKGNNASCVLRIASSHAVVLLTGDIEHGAEKSILVNTAAELLQADILLAPHHGSNSSSSVQFLHAIKPKYVLYSVGYGNRYHFPADRIRQRYGALGIQQLSSATSGSIQFLLTDKAMSLPIQQRLNPVRLWY